MLGLGRGIAHTCHEFSVVFLVGSLREPATSDGNAVDNGVDEDDCIDV
jgi:hypothetical protein